MPPPASAAGALRARAVAAALAPAGCDAAAAGEVFAGERGARAQLRGTAEEDDLPAALAGAGAEVEDAVGLQHDLRIVLDHHQRVAGIAQALHHADDALHVARVQADRGLIEHEQRVDERGAERSGEIDALDLSAREGARLPIEREIAEAHIDQVTETPADLPEQQLGRLIERPRQLELAEEGVAALDGQQHHVVNATAPGATRASAALHSHALRAKARRAAASAAAASSRLPMRHSSASGLEARAVAGIAGRVGAVARQQHAHVHLVGARLEPGEEALHAVPDLPRQAPSPSITHRRALGGQLAPGRVERNAAQLRELVQVLLALRVGLGLPRFDRAAAQRPALVRDDEPVVDADGAAEAAAGLAGARAVN